MLKVPNGFTRTFHFFQSFFLQTSRFRTIKEVNDPQEREQCCVHFADKNLVSFSTRCFSSFSELLFIFLWIVLLLKSFK